MAATQSFDVTTGCDLQEVDNAVNQAMKEIRQRYDFKGADVAIEFKRAENKLSLLSRICGSIPALVARQAYDRGRLP
jgi:hypothetical protein